MGHVDFGNRAGCAQGPLMLCEGFQMKQFILISMLWGLGLLRAEAQGTFLFSNTGAPTRVGSSNGPLAGPDFWAQMFVGLTPESLQPVGTPDNHGASGLVFHGDIVVPDIEGGLTAFVQMWAWNGAQWGTSVNEVPLNQFGKTDIVPITLSFPSQTTFPPQFTQGAIVPIPEPSAVALAVVGAGLLWCATRARRRKSSPPRS